MTICFCIIISMKLSQAERELSLRDDDMARAEEAGVVVKTCVECDMPHVFVLANRVTPEARRAMDEAAAFLREAGAPSSAVA